MVFYENLHMVYERLGLQTYDDISYNVILNIYTYMYTCIYYNKINENYVKCP